MVLKDKDSSLARLEVIETSIKQLHGTISRRAGWFFGGVAVAEGNLSVHLSRLEEAGLIWMKIGFVGKRPKTRLGITPQGRRELASYIENLKEILDLS